MVPGVRVWGSRARSSASLFKSWPKMGLLSLKVSENFILNSGPTNFLQGPVVKFYRRQFTKIGPQNIKKNENTIKKRDLPFFPTWFWWATGFAWNFKPQKVCSDLLERAPQKIIKKKCVSVDLGNNFFHGQRDFPKSRPPSMAPFTLPIALRCCFS